MIIKAQKHLDDMLPNTQEVYKSLLLLYFYVLFSVIKVYLLNLDLASITASSALQDSVEVEA